MYLYQMTYRINEIQNKDKCTCKPVLHLLGSQSPRSWGLVGHQLLPNPVCAAGFYGQRFLSLGINVPLQQTAGVISPLPHLDRILLKSGEKWRKVKLSSQPAAT